jgi:hypothetical protein
VQFLDRKVAVQLQAVPPVAQFQGAAGVAVFLRVRIK